MVGQWREPHSHLQSTQHHTDLALHPTQALSEEPSDLLGDVSPSNDNPAQQHTYEKIRAVSDFAPIKEKVRK